MVKIPTQYNKTKVPYYSQTHKKESFTGRFLKQGSHDILRYYLQQALIILPTQNGLQTSKIKKDQNDHDFIRNFSRIKCIMESIKSPGYIININGSTNNS